MKTEKLIIISVLLLLNIKVNSQDIALKEAFYEYELTPMGEIADGIDTTYKVILIIDTLEIRNLISLDYEADNITTKIKVKDEDLAVDPKVKIKKDKYRLEMDVWSGRGEIVVIGERPDGAKVVMKDKGKKDMVEHEVSEEYPKKRKLIFFEGESVVEPVPIPEPEPEEPDTTAYRKIKNYS